MKQNKQVEQIIKETGVVAIPETNDYANGWNDCRKRAFKELQKKKPMIQDLLSQARQEAVEEEREENRVKTIKVIWGKVLEYEWGTEKIVLDFIKALSSKEI